MVFDISWGELFVVGTLGGFVLGRKNVPKVFFALGKQCGRVVGFVQGAQAQVARNATSKEIKALQKEFRTNMRELDAVRMEMTLAANPVMMGANRNTGTIKQTNVSSTHSVSKMNAVHTDKMNPESEQHKFSANSGTEVMDYGVNADHNEDDYNLAPRAHSVAAVVEEEWDRRGMGFKSVAEKGVHNPTNQSTSIPGGGSFLLADVMQQTLIHDQYDRVVLEQEKLLRSKSKTKND